MQSRNRNGLALLLVIAFAVGSVSGGLINNLPGLNTTLSWKQYSGYIDVDPHNGRNLFYWFTESQSNPKTDPLVLWLNGGPGCSSLGGLFQELGPFIPNIDGKTLALNPYSWNKVANVIFLESPAGVGFSYSRTTSDYTVGDQRTANDAYIFLLEFLKQFPQYQNNDFWVTGESYGGHYVPNLTKRIVLGNQQGGNPKINLKGYMAGNAWTDAPLDNRGAAVYWVNHAIISDSTFLGINATCDFSQIGPLYEKATPKGLADPVQCDHYLNLANQEMGNINIYQIYSDVCLSNNDGHELLRRLSDADTPFSSFAQKATTTKSATAKPEWYPCSSAALQTYLNTPAVIQAIHAAKLPYQWTDCSPRVNYSRADLLSSMLPVYQFLLKQGLKILVYSGDVDGIVPWPGTKMWLDVLNLRQKNAWRPWIASNKQVAGYVTEYEGLTFATVRGAGHLVPGTQPLRALDMFSRFLNGKPL